MSYEENKKAFVNRLVESGWTEEEAAAEYERECGADPTGEE